MKEIFGGEIGNEGVRIRPSSYTTLTDMPRNVLFEGQLEDPSAPGHRLYPTRFCRDC